MDDLVLKEFYAVISSSKQEMFDRIAAERTRFLTVVVENAYQEHNASAILRSCDCFGIQDMHAIEKNNNYRPQRDIARGAGRWVDIKRHNQGENITIQCFDELKAAGYRLIVTSPHAEKDINEIALDQPLAIVFGTEGEGVSQQAIDAADELVRIPMYGFTESLNLSVSVAVTLENIRTRLEKMPINWKLSPEEQVRLKIQWSKSILRAGEEMEKRFRADLK